MLGVSEPSAQTEKVIINNNCIDYLYILLHLLLFISCVLSSPYYNNNTQLYSYNYYNISSRDVSCGTEGVPGTFAWT